MCVAALAWQADSRWKLVAIGNRDEFHERPTAPLSAWGDGRILAGRDLQAGGTWLGVGAAGFGLVTNLRVPGYPRPELASRGALVSDWLRGNPPSGAAAMNPFNLWLADPGQLRFVTNHPEPREIELGKGIHGLSNGPHGDRWFKTARLESALERWLQGGKDVAALFDALRDATPETADPEDVFSPVFIRNPTYGTRCSTVVTVDAAGCGRITERRYDPAGNPSGETALDFAWPDQA